MKLDKKQGWELVRTLLNSWMIKENTLSDVEEILDSYFAEIGEAVYLHALDWNGGMSSDERSKFSNQICVRDEHSSLNDSYHYDEEYDVTIVSDMILQLTNYVRKFIDVDMVTRTAEVYSITVTQPVTTHHIKCPYCSQENRVNSFDRKTTCTKCKVGIELRHPKAGL